MWCSASSISQVGRKMGAHSLLVCLRPSWELLAKAIIIVDGLTSLTSRSHVQVFGTPSEVEGIRRPCAISLRWVAADRSDCNGLMGFCAPES